MNPIRILVIEPETITRAAICALIEREQDFSLVSSAGSLKKGFDLARRYQPDVIISEACYGDVAVERVVAILLAAAPASQICILAEQLDGTLAAKALTCGAFVCCAKAADPHEVMQALRTIAAGKPILRPILPAGARSNGAHRDVLLDRLQLLTRQELAIVKLITHGHSNAEIGVILRMARNTVRTHIVRIMNKLELANRTQIALFALRRGIVQLEQVKLPENPDKSPRV